MQNNLLPCPFCGGEAELFHDEYFINRAFVFCGECGAQTKLYAKGYVTEKAINDWNTRKPMERIIEQLEEYREEATQLGVGGMLTDIIEVVRNGGKE